MGGGGGRGQERGPEIRGRGQGNSGSGGWREGFIGVIRRKRIGRRNTGKPPEHVCTWHDHDERH